MSDHPPRWRTCSTSSSGGDLVEALLGGRGAVGARELGFGITAALAIVGFVWRARGRRVLALLSPEIAATAGIRVARPRCSRRAMTQPRDVGS
ncbi:MAG TPA: hypothetical protein VF516_21265, partial [Kofleriaceae bacterium]